MYRARMVAPLCITCIIFILLVFASLLGHSLQSLVKLYKNVHVFGSGGMSSTNNWPLFKFFVLCSFH